MSKKTGIVMKVTEKYIVLMMPDGSFKNVKRAYDHTPLLGERMDAEMSSFPAASLRWISVGAAAVCLLLAVLLISGKTQIGSNPTFTVALDINPSMEIQLNDNSNIIGITALNDDADNVLKNVDYKNKYLGEALSDIIDICAVQGYFSQEGESLIYVSVIPIDEQYAISKDDISSSLHTALENNNINALINIKDVHASVLDEAHKLDMSVNRYIIYSELSAEGVALTAEEAGRMSMSELKNISEDQKNKNKNAEYGVQKNDKQGNNSQGKVNNGDNKNETGSEGNVDKENGKGENNKQENGKAKTEVPKDKSNDSNDNGNPGKNNNSSSQNSGNNQNSKSNSNSSNTGNNGNGNNRNNNEDKRPERIQKTPVKKQ